MLLEKLPATPCEGQAFYPNIKPYVYAIDGNGNKIEGEDRLIVDIDIDMYLIYTDIKNIGWKVIINKKEKMYKVRSGDGYVFDALATPIMMTSCFSDAEPFSLQEAAWLIEILDKQGIKGYIELY